MSNNYEEYGYENNRSEKSATFRRRLLIIILIVVAIILFLFLLKGCTKKGNKPDNKVAVDYESTLLEAGKRYFDLNPNKKPTLEGTCEDIELQALIDRELVKSKDFEKCNVITSYVRVCKLENGKLHYYPWLTCSDKNSESEYKVAQVGTLNNVIADKSVITFRYMPQVLADAKQELGPEEELWKDEITYNSYKTLATTTYYRYKDILYRWNVKDKRYYTSNGEKTNAADVYEYYTSTPNSNYTERDSGATAYKWYTTSSKKVYAVDKNGTKVYSDTAIEGYPHNEGGVCIEYQTRTVTGTSQPKHYYVCAKSKNSLVYKYQLHKCGTSPDADLAYEIDNFWTCGSGSEEDLLNGKVNSSSTTCKTYSNWQNSEKSCDTSLDTCRRINPHCYYTWYKLESDGDRKYYPSGSSSASGENVYYTSAPVSGAVKDESSSATAYKWFNSTSRVTDYLAVAPSGDATKTGESRETEWTSYSTNNPQTNDGRDRTIESKVKIKLQEIKGMTDASWKDLATEYLSLDEMIHTCQLNKYDVNTLEDIQNNGELKYKLQMLIRNKKESK